MHAPSVLFKRNNNLQISPIVSSDDEDESDDISVVEDKEYSIPFDWGESGEVEIRTVK